MSASTTQTIRFFPQQTGAYDEFGQYYSGTSAESVSFAEGPGAAVPAEVAYATFNAAAIENEVQSLEAADDVVSLSLNYEVADSYGVEHPVTVNEGFLYHTGYQSSVEADQTNNTGPGVGDLAYVFDDVDQRGYEQVQSHQNLNFDGTQGEHLSGTLDISSDIQQAAAYMGGRDLLVTLNEPQEGGQGTGFLNNYSGGIDDHLVAPQIVLTYTSLGPPPTISGSVAGQHVGTGGSDTPFASVGLADPGNTGGAGDRLYITILDGSASGSATDSLGYLTDSSGAPLTEFATGSYALAPATSLSQLQQTLDSLRFQSSPTSTGSTAVFELDLQSTSGRTADDSNSSVTVACFATGTRLLTDRGGAPVESLAIGDVVITAAGQARPVRWIGRRGYAGRFLSANPRIQPIRFVAGSLGDGLPRQDLLVSPEHAMLLDGVLVPARCLVNGATIVRERGAERVDYVHVELDTHDVLLAEGAPSESFFDDDCRGVFHNAREHAALYPDAAAAGGRCAPLVEGGAALEAIRGRLAGVARTSSAA